MNRRTTLGIAGTCVLAAAISVASIAVSDHAEPAGLRRLGTGAAAANTALGGDAPTDKRAAPDLRLARPVEYRVAGELPALDGEQVAYRFVEHGIDADRVALLADRLGVEGRTELTEWGDWTITGDTHVLTVSAQPGHPWYLSPKPADTPDRPVVECLTDPCPEPQRPAGLPTAAEARRAGTALLGELGVDLATTTGVRVDDGFNVWFVSASPRVGDLETLGLDWSVGIGPKSRLEFANGWFDRPVRGDTYPLIGTAAAIERLRNQPNPILFSDAPSAIRCLDCPAGEIEPFVHVLTKARLAYQLLGSDFVPTYVFSTEDGGEVIAPALDDRYLVVDGPTVAQPLDGRTDIAVDPPAPSGKG